MKSFLVLFFACLVPSIFASSCLERPSILSKGASCSQDMCGPDLYCDNKFICSPLIEDGASCIPDFEGCSELSTCKGPDSKEICVKNAGPGDSCSSDRTVTTASCVNDLTCSFTSSRCTGGHYGDKCAANADCNSEVCSTSLVCGLPATITNATCSSLNNDKCGKDYYCTFSGCQPRLATGAQCTTTEECPISNFCGEKNEGDEFSYCIAPGTLDAGSFCNDEDSLCKSGVCSDSYCSDTYPVYCSGNCGSLGICFCGSKIIWGGIGECKKNSCLTQYQDYQKCLFDNCISLNFYNYYSACSVVNCSDERDTLSSCAEKKFGFSF